MNPPIARWTRPFQLWLTNRPAWAIGAKGWPGIVEYLEPHVPPMPARSPGEQHWDKIDSLYELARLFRQWEYWEPAEASDGVA